MPFFTVVWDKKRGEGMKKFSLQNVYIVFLCIQIVLLVIGGFVIHENKWKLREGNPCDEIEPKEYEILSDDTQSYTFVGESGNMAYCLLFYTNHQEVEVYTDGNLVYERRKVNTIFGHTSGSAWNMVDISADTKEIVVRLKAVYESGENNQHIFYKGRGVSILQGMVRDSVFAMGVSVLLVVIGVCMVIFWLFLCRKKDVARELLYMGLSAVLIGIWAFTEEKPVMVLLENRVYASYLTYVLLMLIGVTFMLFVKHYIAREGRYFHKFLAMFAIGGMTLMMILQWLNIADFKETVWIVHIVLVGDLLYFLLGILRKMRSGRTRKHLGLNTAGLLVLVLAVGVELYAYYSRIANMQIFGMFGLLAYIMILGLETASDAAEKIAEIQKAEIYKELAQKDMLTKCYNRNAYSEDITKLLSGGIDFQEKDKQENCSRKIEKGKQENVYIVMFDLNNLKKCNDTLGHMEGDRYLTDSADLIKKIFEGYGKVYRIGGDEFCVIMKNSSEEKIEGLIRMLMREESVYNESSEMVCMQIAAGYARYDPRLDADLDKTRSRADMLMYENKKWLKNSEQKMQKAH